MSDLNKKMQAEIEKQGIIRFISNTWKMDDAQALAVVTGKKVVEDL